MERNAPGIAEHDEARAVGEKVFDGEGGAGGFEAGAVGGGVAADDGEMEAKRGSGGVVGDGRGGVGVEFDDDEAGVVGEEVGEGRVVAAAGDGEAEVIDIPAGVGAGVGDVEGEVFESHEGKVRERVGA